MIQFSRISAIVLRTDRRGRGGRDTSYEGKDGNGQIGTVTVGVASEASVTTSSVQEAEAVRGGSEA